MDGLKGLLQSKRGMTLVVTAVLDALVSVGLVVADQGHLVEPLVTLITTLSAVVVGGYALSDTFGKGKIEAETKKVEAETEWKKAETASTAVDATTRP